MNREQFKQLTETQIVLLDGATGSNLMKAGMPAGVCPEQWILEHERVLIELQKSYLKSGTNILYTPTFSGNRLKLEEYGLADQLKEMNTKLVGLSKQAVAEYKKETADADRACYIAADMTMTGRQVAPIGTLTFEELVNIYKEQAAVLVEAGVDLFVVETMMSLQECRAAVLAIRETTDLPVMVTLTFTEEGTTLYGTEPETAVLVLQGLGADAIGVNCSTGPEQMEAVVRRMKAVANVPVIAKPNAGLPKLVDGETQYDMGPVAFAEGVEKLVEAGAGIVGGCCGTTPEHIRALYEKVAGKEVPKVSKKHIRAVTNERHWQELTADGAFILIGERINPTGKKALQAQLREGNTDMVLQFAEEQEQLGAKILDINVGMNGIDEKEMMCRVLTEVTNTADLPLCLDTSSVEVMEAALRLYPGRALMNSISLEEHKMEPMLALAKKYGAMFILLPLSSKGLPESQKEKHTLIHTLLERALELGFAKEDILVDALVTTVGANPQAANEVLGTIRYCKEQLGLLTTCGLSNISFGLPERGCLNSTFLTMAMAYGMNAAIANPSIEAIRQTICASELLLAKEEAADRYISYVNEKQERVAFEQAKMPVQANTVQAAGLSSTNSQAEKKSIQAAGLSGTNSQAEKKSIQVVELSSVNQPVSNKSSQVDGLGNAESLTKKPFAQEKIQSVVSNEIEKQLTSHQARLKQAVLKGDRKHIVAWTEEALQAGERAEVLLQDVLMPAIQEVGVLFEKKKYFLPQLIGSAEAMKLSVEKLEPLLAGDGAKETKGTIVIATVQGDIHDIGKNLVALMLKNYGFMVYDLGKDVPAEVIVQKAKETNADIIALSALMTTTMQEMKRVVTLCKQSGVTAKIMIGGAVITESYAEEIGADGYSKDAAEAVEVAGKLLRVNETES